MSAQEFAHETPAVTSAATDPTVTASQANSDPVRTQDTSALLPESKPELGGLTDGSTAAARTAPNVSNVPKEEKIGKGEVLVESHPINEGILNYKGPGLKGLIFSKKYFWFSDAPLEHKHLTAYVGNEKSKDIAHPNAAHATQTGKGLLFFAKRAEDKDHPQGIFNLADVQDVLKGNFNDFGFSLHGHKHNFQALTKSEKDAWIVAIETKADEAKTSREGIVGSPGYKIALEKYGVPAAAATTGTSRSLSRPGKKASKSRERKIADTKAEANSSEVASTNAATPAEPATDKTPTAVPDHITGPHHHKTAEEAAAGTAAVGAVTAAEAKRNGSTSEEDKKAKKSRSQSRGNKRSSIFGGLLAKKEDHDIKKDVKKEEKEEKKEQKAEDKVIKKEVKSEDKAEKKEAKLEKKAEKHEAREELKEEKSLEKVVKHEHAGHAGEFDPAAVAARVVGEPVLPAAGGAALGTTETAPASTPANVATPTSANQDTAAKPNKRGSVFGGFFGKKETSTSSATDTPPVVPAKDEPAAVPSSGVNTDTSAAPGPAQGATGPTTGTTTTEAGINPTGATTSPTDRRRSSFFNNLGTKKERRTGGSSDTAPTDVENKKQTSGGFGGLLRKASRAQGRSTQESAAKEAAEVPLPKDNPTTAGTVTDGAIDAQKPGLSEGEVGSHAIARAEEHQTPVSTAA